MASPQQSTGTSHGMDVKHVIHLMTKISSVTHFDMESLESNLKCVQALDSCTDHINEYENKSIRFSYILKIHDLMIRLKYCLLNHNGDTTDVTLSVSQCATVSKCIDIVVSLSFVTCLIPKLWVSFEKKQNAVIQFIEDISDKQKYEELKINVDLFLNLIKEPTLKRLIMTKYTNVLLAGLCQLSLLPITKPDTETMIGNSEDKIQYEQLVNEQNMYESILRSKVLEDRDPLFIREIIFILGNKKCQKHLKLRLGELFSDLIIQSDGIKTFLRIACDLTAETSQNFTQHGLQEWSSLIHNYYVKLKYKYCTFIIPQIWELLRTDSKLHQHNFRSVAVFSIHLVANENHNDFLTYYMNPIFNQLKIRVERKENENVSVSQCIEDLHVMFYLFKNEIWSINPKSLIQISATIYNLYTATVSGIYYLKSKLEDLMYLVLTSFSNCKDHLKFIIFSQTQIHVKYEDDGKNLQLGFINREHQLHLETQCDLILNLLNKRENWTLMKTLFITLLDMYIDMSLSNEYSLMEKVFIVKAIKNLIVKEELHKAIINDGEKVLKLIGSILKEIAEGSNTFDVQTLSIALMILGCVLEAEDNRYVNQLEDFRGYLSKIVQTLKDDEFKDLVLEMQNKIGHVLNTGPRNPVGHQRTIDDVLLDTRDPLLPVRSHALIELKKMIESGDKTVLVKHSAILVVIQECLKNADSYLYLSAMFTLSSLCSHYPNDILPILCEEYCLPENYNHSAETRLKIGEVLMKTVKSLNEMIPLYKNRLLNTFMAGVRDSDHLVRASSLSNLADVCRLLRFSLGLLVYEIINCVKYVLQFDVAVEPRRAAVLLLRMIIQGADTELLEILEGNVKDIYGILKNRYQYDNDDTVKLHAQVAIETLNDTMKTLLFKEDVKNLRINN